MKIIINLNVNSFQLPSVQISEEVLKCSRWSVLECYLISFCLLKGPKQQSVPEREIEYKCMCEQVHLIVVDK